MPVAPFGSWPSPITPDLLTQQVVALSQVCVADGAVWWNEGRPQEGGRQVVVRSGPEGDIADVLPEGFSARTRVHEYGGGAYTVHRDTLFFSNFADQRLWRVEADGSGAPPRPLTPEPPAPGAHRYADAVVSPDGRWLVCVRERHPVEDSGEVVNDLVALPTSGDGEPVVLGEGRDFFAAPRLSPDGRTLAWLYWDHPNMPWDGTELWTTGVDGEMRVASPRLIAGGPDESVSQPRWSPDGTLHWVSDRSGWWNLYSDDGTAGRPLAPMEAEFARPDWVFGQSSYTFLSDGRLVAAWTEEGIGYLGVVEEGRVEPLPTQFTEFSSLQPFGSGVVALAASARRAPAVLAIDLDSGRSGLIRASRPVPVPQQAVSEGRPFEYPTEAGLTAHAFWYPPRLEGFQGPQGERPPLIVRSHGGPTGSASPALNLEIQFWTSRGFTVVDVDYGGSAGYGREYRRRLDGRWGEVDLDDCVNAARYLAEVGHPDPDRMAVRGESADGYTTLCALTFRQLFAAGASYYGVADLERLTADTHKFESRYLDRLIGPLPEAVDVYRSRSPVHFADRITAPVILLQGLEDAVVPPSQAEMLVASLRANRIPFAYLAFEGEQHGFRRAETIRRAVEAELSFYGQVLGFEPAGGIEPVEIENADRLGEGRVSPEGGSG